MKTIEQLYNEIIKNPREWMYWSCEEDSVSTVENVLSDFSSMYSPEKVDKLIYELLRYGGKVESSIVSNIDRLKADRKRHVVSLFFIGHLLYNKLDIIKTKVNHQLLSLKFPKYEVDKHDEQRLFSFVWILLCLFHDLGYAYEEGEITVENSISIVEIYKALKTRFQPTIYNVENIRKYNDYRLCQWGVKDHGIWGGKVFYKDMLKIKDLLQIKALQVENTEIFCSKEVDHIYAYAAWVIICHNLRYNDGNSAFTTCFKCQHLDDFIKPKARCISLKSNPLLFLFCLADTLEPTKTLKSSMPNPQKSRDICKLLEIDISDNTLSFNLQKLEDYKVGNDYKNIVTSLNDWLIDVDLKKLSIDFG